MPKYEYTVAWSANQLKTFSEKGWKIVGVTSTRYGGRTSTAFHLQREVEDGDAKLLAGILCELRQLRGMLARLLSDKSKEEAEGE
jgi:hypothetical protein